MGTASVGSITATGNCTSAATSDVTDVSEHPLLVDQPDVVRQLVDNMMAKWKARTTTDVTGVPTDNDGTVQLDVVEVDGDLASSVLPQVHRLCRYVMSN